MRRRLHQITGCPGSTRGPQTGPATKTTRRTSDGPQRPSLSVATSWCQGLDPRSPQTDLAINDRNAQEHQHRRGRSMPEPIRRVKNIPQKKSYSLAGVFRYWLGAIRSVIDAAILDSVQFSPVQTGTHQSASELRAEHITVYFTIIQIQ